MPTIPLPRLYAPITVGGVRGGSPLTLDRAIEVLEQLVDAQEAVTRDYYRAFDRFERAKTPATRARWRGTMDELRPAFVKFDRAVERLENQIDAYGDALVRRDEEVAAKRAEPPEELPGEPTAEEWQFGLEYEASRRTGKGRPEDSNVDFNVDIRRKDGRPITESEAKAALRSRIDTGMFPSQYEFAFIAYRSPNSGSIRATEFGDHTHSVDELDDAFDSVFQATNINDWRAGGIDA